MPPVVDNAGLSVLLKRLAIGGRGEFETGDAYDQRVSASFNRWLQGGVRFAIPVALHSKYPCEAKLAYDVDSGEWTVKFGFIFGGGLPLTCQFASLGNVVVSNGFGARNVVEVVRATKWSVCPPNRIDSPDFSFPMSPSDAQRLAPRLAIAMVVKPVEGIGGTIITSDTTKPSASVTAREAQLEIEHCINSEGAIAVVYDGQSRRILYRHDYTP